MIVELLTLTTFLLLTAPLFPSSLAPFNELLLNQEMSGSNFVINISTPLRRKKFTDVGLGLPASWLRSTHEFSRVLVIVPRIVVVLVLP